MKPKHKRLIVILSGLVVGFLYIGVMLNKFSDNLEFFFSPSDFHKITPGKIVRVGGLVSKKILEEKLCNSYEFIITDNKADLIIKYKGKLPALFREGQGVIARGKLENNIFIANELLTKHDEYYVPKEVKDALK